MKAAISGHVEIITLLLDAGAEASAAGADACTALELAKRHSQAETAEALNGGPVDMPPQSEIEPPSPQNMARDLLGRAALIPLVCVLCCERVVPADDECNCCTVIWGANCCEHSCWNVVCCCLRIEDRVGKQGFGLQNL